MSFDDSVSLPTDAQVLHQVREAFAECRRPDHFTDFRHCEECAEHDEVLRFRDIHTLQIEDVGNPGWDPICFTTTEGFIYYLPALARLALVQPTELHDWYGVQLIYNLCLDGRQNRRFLACSPEQQRAIVEFLRHLVETRLALADTYGYVDELFQALEIWTDKSQAL